MMDTTVNNGKSKTQGGPLIFQYNKKKVRVEAESEEREGKETSSNISKTFSLSLSVWSQWMLPNHRELTVMCRKNGFKTS